MIGKVKIDYQEFDRELRLLLEAKSAHFYRESGDNGYSYQFPNDDLTMTVQPYDVKLNKKTSSAATLVFFDLLHANNQAFAQTLTEAIDKMLKTTK